MKNKITIFIIIMILIFTNIAFAIADTNMENFSKNTAYSEFNDVKNTNWYFNDVKSVCQFGLISGYPNGSFNPDGQVTLAEAITIASRIYNIYVGGKGEFNTQKTPWYDEAVNYAIRKEIINATSFCDQNGKVNYNRAATRDEIAFIFAKVFPSNVYQPINSVVNIPDVNYTTAYYQSIFQMYKAGVILGDNKGYFHPKNNVKRSELAAILNRLIDSSVRQKE